MKFTKINYELQNSPIKNLKKQIDNGFKLQELSDEQINKLDDEEIIDIVDSIILHPEYQREYRYSISDESLLIESILIGIPIPPIFLANDRYKGMQVLNVVDGQHRLNAFSRFISNKFPLQGLKILNELNGKKFKDLDLPLKEKLTASNIQQIVFKEFPGKEFELEIFNRYNKGTKPLTPQEIRHAVYSSKENEFVNDFSKFICRNKKLESFYNYSPEKLIVLGKIYNATEDRYLKKKTQESIFVILNILEYGFSENLKKSPEYADLYMERKSIEEDEIRVLHSQIFSEKNKTEQDIIKIIDLQNSLKTKEKNNEENFVRTINVFKEFNDFIINISNKIEFPFSRELYGIASRNYKFQISIAMILAGLAYKLNKNGHSLNDIKNIDKLLAYLKEILSNSYLEDPDYSASSTNYVELSKLNDAFDIEFIIKN
ncbi:DUF262 domain-containing protein [Acinetobacter indicus]|uniref:DUF262 domain-containing protein n=1 Tax=Acinetobacter indicus TaxID=756892 RepID=UPI001443E5E9|nr:DUF262 domain-containing protein [Acinetobacter indicus]